MQITLGVTPPSASNSVGVTLCNASNSVGVALCTRSHSLRWLGSSVTALTVVAGLAETERQVAVLDHVLGGGEHTLFSVGASLLDVLANQLVLNKNGC